MRENLKYLVIIFALIVFSVSSINAQSIKYIDFSEAQGYTDGQLVGQPAGADVTWQSGSSDPPDSFEVQDEQLVVTPTGEVDVWTYITFPPQTEGPMTVTWDWQYVGPEDSTVDVGFCISDTNNFDIDGDPNLGWPEQGAMCRMQQNTAVIDARFGDWFGGGQYQAAEEYPYTDGSLIHMRYVIDVDINVQTYDFFAQKEGEDEVQLADDFPYRREVTDQGLNAITMWGIQGMRQPVP